MEVCVRLGFPSLFLRGRNDEEQKPDFHTHTRCHILEEILCTHCYQWYYYYNQYYQRRRRKGAEGRGRMEEGGERRKEQGGRREVLKY